MIAAIFDVDETIINFKSLISFYKFFFSNKKSTEEVNTSLYQLLDVMESSGREEANIEYYRHFRGIKYDELENAGYKWANHIWHHGCLNPSVYQKLIWHIKSDHKIIFASGGFEPSLAPLLDKIIPDVKYKLFCTILEVDKSGVCTGLIKQKAIASHKAKLIDHFIDLHKILKADSYSYSDDISDAPLLELFGHPHAVVSEDTIFYRYAVNNGYKILLK